MSTLVHEIAKSHSAAGFSPTTQSTLVRPLQSIIQEYSVETIHFLKIDVEGFEEQVLRGLDLQQARPWIILYECTTPNTNVVNDGNIPDILTSNGYRFGLFDGINKFFVSIEQIGRLSSLYPANIVDNFRKFDHQEAAESRALLMRAQDYAVDLQKHLDNKEAIIQQHIARTETLEPMLEQARDYAVDLRKHLDNKEAIIQQHIARTETLERMFEQAHDYAADLRQHLDVKTSSLRESITYSDSMLRALRSATGQPGISDNIDRERIGPNLRVAFTICSINYLAYAKTLQQSFRHHHDIRFVIFVADRPQIPVEKIDIIDVIYIDESIAPNFESMAALYTIMEYNTAVKPHCIDYLIDVIGATCVVYVDPDIVITSSLDVVFDTIDAGFDCVLTPHITAPLDDGKYPDDLAISRAGIYNLGFLGVSSRPEARRFVAWWRRWLETDCVVDLARGVFVDQRFCDFAPSFIDRTFILRDPGFNLAYWNLLHRELSLVDGTLSTGGAPVKFIHFSGVDKSNPNQFSKHQDRYTRANLGALLPIFDSYVESLIENDKFSGGGGPSQKFRTGSANSHVA